jgi:hypothetical protein
MREEADIVRSGQFDPTLISARLARATSSLGFWQRGPILRFGRARSWYAQHVAYQRGLLLRFGLGPKLGPAAWQNRAENNHPRGFACGAYGFGRFGLCAPHRRLGHMRPSDAARA